MMSPIHDHPSHLLQNLDGTWTCSVGWNETIAGRVRGCERSFTAWTAKEAIEKAHSFLRESLR